MDHQLYKTLLSYKSDFKIQPNTSNQPHNFADASMLTKAYADMYLLLPNNINMLKSINS